MFWIDANIVHIQIIMHIYLRTHLALIFIVRISVVIIRFVIYLMHYFNGHFVLLRNIVYIKVQLRLAGFCFFLWSRWWKNHFHFFYLSNLLCFSYLLYFCRFASLLRQYDCFVGVMSLVMGVEWSTRESFHVVCRLYKVRLIRLVCSHISWLHDVFIHRHASCQILIHLLHAYDYFS